MNNLHGIAFVESLRSGEYCDSGKYGISRHRYTVRPAEELNIIINARYV